MLKFMAATYSCPDDVGEGPDIQESSWAVKVVALCAAMSLILWARKRHEIRGVGLSKKRGDAMPAV